MKKKRTQDIVFVLAFVLFILQIVLLPLFVGVTYASKSLNPEHTITYSSHQLLWDRNTQVDLNGVAQLSLFESIYENVNSNQGDNVFAPGTKKESIVRLVNKENTKIRYTVVVYYESTNDQLPLDVYLGDGNFNDVQYNNYPDTIDSNSIVRVVSGELEKNRMQEFDICWEWKFEGEELDDFIDTYFGNQAANDVADRVSVGFYIVVEADGTTIHPGSASTGDYTMIVIDLFIMVISGLVLLWCMRKDESV